MDKTKFVQDPQLDSEGFLDPKCNTCSPWSLLDQDHLDRIHQIWVNSAEKYRQQLADWYYEAQTEAKL